MFRMANTEEMKREIGNSYLKASHVGICKIIGLEQVFGSNGSASKGLKILVSTIEGEANFSIWYAKKDGSENEFGIQQLTAVMGIAKLNPANFKVEIEHTNFGKEIHKVAMSTTPEIGLYLEAKEEEYNGKSFTKHEFKGAFYPQNKKTVAEQLNNKEATQVKVWIEKVKSLSPTLAPAKETESQDEFPF
ncbi:MAG: hypothetical protein ACRC6A_09355 [Fusobacteriaceae bacterium]